MRKAHGQKNADRDYQLVRMIGEGFSEIGRMRFLLRQGGILTNGCLRRAASPAPR
jgi:hypothetical protein